MEEIEKVLVKAVMSGILVAAFSSKVSSITQYATGILFKMSHLSRKLSGKRFSTLAFP